MDEFIFELDKKVNIGKISDNETFRLCSLGAIDVEDIDNFLIVLKEALKSNNVTIPVQY